MSKNIFKYKGYTCEIKFSPEDKCYYGKVEGLKREDLVLVEGQTVKEAARDFKESVDEYMELCEKLQIDP